MRLLANSRDSLSLKRVLSWAPGVGPKRQSQLARGLGATFTTASLQGLKVPAAAQTFFENLAPRVDGWRTLANESPTDLMEQLLGYYQPLMEERFDDWPKRQKDLEALAAMASEATSLSDFLVTLALDPPDRFGSEDEVVKLSLIHI